MQSVERLASHASPTLHDAQLLAFGDRLSPLGRIERDQQRQREVTNGGHHEQRLLTGRRQSLEEALVNEAVHQQVATALVGLLYALAAGEGKLHQCRPTLGDPDDMINLFVTGRQSAPPHQFLHILRVELQLALCHPAYQPRAVSTARSKSIPSRPQTTNLT
ncbi:hypothetical protein Y695_02944 [Hydrogenophaga sp. T4]|nr:hypothetical protein Y695_02944 [Hydrogenophaga sp. T4]